MSSSCSSYPRPSARHLSAPVLTSPASSSLPRTPKCLLPCPASQSSRNSLPFPRSASSRPGLTRRRLSTRWRRLAQSNGRGLGQGGRGQTGGGYWVPIFCHLCSSIKSWSRRSSERQRCVPATPCPNHPRLRPSSGFVTSFQLFRLGLGGQGLCF